MQLQLQLELKSITKKIPHWHCQFQIYYEQTKSRFKKGVRAIQKI